MFVAIVFQSTYSAIRGHKMGRPDPVHGCPTPLEFGVSAQARCPSAKTPFLQKQEEDYLASLVEAGFVVETRRWDHAVLRRSRPVNGGRLVVEHVVRVWYHINDAADATVPARSTVAPSEQAPVKLPHWRWGTNPTFKTPVYK